MDVRFKDLRLRVMSEKIERCNGLSRVIAQFLKTGICSAGPRTRRSGQSLRPFMAT